MRTALLACALWVGLGGVAPTADTDAEVTRAILALERGTMEGWKVGSPDPTLALLDADVTYVHYPLEKRLEGRAAVAAFFEKYRGRPLFDSCEMADPSVRVSGDVAVLTYQLVTRVAAFTDRWNSTEVYEKGKDGWRIVHAHWSRVAAPQPPEQP